MEMAQRNKLNRKSYARLFLAGDSLIWHIFKGETALPAQTNKAEQHVGVHEDSGWNTGKFFAFSRLEAWSW